MQEKLALIGFEWAGSLIRAWAFGPAGEILSAIELRERPVVNDPNWPSRLRFDFSEWLGDVGAIPIIGCGDVPARLVPASGQVISTPAALAQLPQNLVQHDGIHLIPWISQHAPPDLTCGAEAVLVGLGDANGSICIAGPHTRHCVVEHGRLMEFSTEITAELRDLLLSHGTLSLNSDSPQTFDAKVFRDWIERALDTDDSPPVFSVEAAIRQGLLSPANKAAALAGLMIGADVAAHYDPGDEVLLVADGPLLEAYGFALDALGADVEETSAVEALQDGLFELADLAGLLGED